MKASAAPPTEASPRSTCARIRENSVGLKVRAADRRREASYERVRSASVVDLVREDAYGVVPEVHRPPRDEAPDSLDVEAVLLRRPRRPDE